MFYLVYLHKGKLLNTLFLTNKLHIHLCSTAPHTKSPHQSSVTAQSLNSLSQSTWTITRSSSPKTPTAPDHERGLLSCVTGHSQGWDLYPSTRLQVDPDCHVPQVFIDPFKISLSETVRSPWHCCLHKCKCKHL